MVSSVKESFAELVDRVASEIYENRRMLAKNQKEFVIGDVAVRRRTDNYFDLVRKTDGRKLYSDIYLLEAALLLAKYFQLNNREKIKKVLALECDYVKHHHDMRYFSVTHRNARAERNYDLMDIMQARYQVSKQLARDSKESIRKMCSTFTTKR
jgi:hypothetical protein